MKFEETQWEKDIERQIGRSALIKLERAYGRTYLYIPSPKPSKELVRLIGKDKAQKLTDEFGGGDIYVPIQMLKNIRNHNIIEESNAGKTVKELAEKYRLTKEWVIQILKEKHGYGEYKPGRAGKGSK
jgi:hypothetical protein